MSHPMRCSNACMRPGRAVRLTLTNASPFLISCLLNEAFEEHLCYATLAKTLNMITNLPRVENSIFSFSRRFDTNSLLHRKQQCFTMHYLLPLVTKTASVNQHSVDYITIESSGKLTSRGTSTVLMTFASRKSATHFFERRCGP